MADETTVQSSKNLTGRPRTVNNQLRRMGDKSNAQTPGQRTIIDSLAREFARLHSTSCLFAKQLNDGSLYATPPGSSNSVGECILRCTAEIEQTFGGITANLWDDPFEWTLPEHLSTTTKLIEHLNDVEALRQRAFTSFLDDSCLSQDVATPSDTRPLIDLLLRTLLRATGYQAQAAFTLNNLSDIEAPGFII